MKTKKPAASATDLANFAADRRRAALRRLLAEHSITPAELARRAGLPNPNAIYNFLNCRSLALSVTTLEKIMTVMPASGIGSLIGHPGATSNPAPCPSPEGYIAVPIVAHAKAGVLHPTGLMPEAEQKTLLVPSPLFGRDSNAIAVQVDRPGAERLYPAGAVLICTVLPPRIRQFEEGEHLVVQHHRPDGVETTVRRVSNVRRETWLFPESTDPAAQQPLPAPWDSARLGLDVRAIARVLAVWQTAYDRSDF